MKHINILMAFGILLLNIGGLVLIIVEILTSISDGVTLPRLSKVIFILLVTLYLDKSALRKKS